MIQLLKHTKNNDVKPEKPTFSPHAVAKIVAEQIGLDATSIAALLHDVIEDTEYTLEDLERLGERRLLESYRADKIAHLKKDKDVLAG